MSKHKQWHKRIGAPSGRRERGFTMIEMLAALAVAALMIAGVTVLINSSLEDTRAQQAASYQSQMAAAAKQLVQQNYSALVAQATTTTPVVVKMNGSPYQLASYLSSAMNNANAYGQTPCLLVYAAPTAGALQALLVTEGGETISDSELGYIAANSGTGGGAIEATNNPGGAAKGAYGSWTVPVPNPAGASCTGTKTGFGHLASLLFYNGTQAQNSDYLYRVGVPGDPSANTMQVPIVLANQTDYAACTTSGAIAADTLGNVLNCESGIWEPQASYHWRGPVTDAAALSALQSPARGDVAMTLATNRAYTYTGQAWQALAVDEQGVLALGNQQTEGTPCAPTAASTTPVSTDASGHVLSCQNGTWQSQAEINPMTVATDSDCAISVGQPGTSDFVCNTAPSAPAYNSVMGYWYTTVTRRVAALPTNGAVSIYAWTHIEDAYVTSCPSGPKDLSNGQGAYATLYTQVIDADTGNTIASAVNQSSRIYGDLANVNLTVTHALPHNNSGYLVQFTTYWMIYGGANPTSFRPSYCGTGNNIFPLSGVVTTWSITPFY